MRGKLMFLGGVAVGFVLGSRSGRKTYDELARTARRIRENPSVQEAAGVLQSQASRLYEQGRGTVNDRLGHTRLGSRFLNSSDDAPVAAGSPDGVRASTQR